ncbi:hypothetical protein NXV73_26055 [Bacteroides salyersiae]|nr:hypothetical protein [Bacteroides salyersiae]
MTTQDKQTALNAISKAMDEDIENIIEGKEIDIPETEETCFRRGTSLRAPDESD